MLKKSAVVLSMCLGAFPAAAQGVVTANPDTIDGYAITPECVSSILRDEIENFEMYPFPTDLSGAQARYAIANGETGKNAYEFGFIAAAFNQTYILGYTYNAGENDTATYTQRYYPHDGNPANTTYSEFGSEASATTRQLAEEGFARIRERAESCNAFLLG